MRNVIEEYLSTLDAEERHHINNLAGEIKKAIAILGSEPTDEDWVIIIEVLMKEKDVTTISIDYLQEEIDNPRLKILLS